MAVGSLDFCLISAVNLLEMGLEHSRSLYRTQQGSHPVLVIYC